MVLLSSLSASSSALGPGKLGLPASVNLIDVHGPHRLPVTCFLGDSRSYQVDAINTMGLGDLSGF